MKNITPLIIAALLVSLLASCSKRPTQSVWTSSDSFIIEPRVSVGPVHSGMTAHQVVATFGEPDNGDPDKIKLVALKYLNLGISVSLSDGGIVSDVWCWTNSDSGMTKPFTGHTKEGIGIGASRDAIVSAYGNPTKDNSLDGVEFMRYDSLGLHFGLKNDKLLSIGVFFKP
jgi:hypothetical protein